MEAQRREDLSCREYIQRLARRTSHRFAEQERVELAVEDARAGRAGVRAAADAVLDQRVERPRVEAGLGWAEPRIRSRHRDRARLHGDDEQESGYDQMPGMRQPHVGHFPLAPTLCCLMT